MVRIVSGLCLLSILALSSCKKEDKKSEVVEKLVGTWEREPTAEWSNDSTFTFTEYATLTLDGSGTYTLVNTTLDSSVTSTLESEWNVNTAGTKVTLSNFEDYELVLLSDTTLKWEYGRLDEIIVTETYLRQ